MVLAVATLLRMSIGLAPEGSILVIVELAVVGVSAYLAFQWGRAYIRLQSAPIYPRQCYFGVADIAPEERGREAVERRWLIAAVVVILVADLAVVWLAVPDSPAPGAALACGVMFEMWRSWRGLRDGDASRIEQDLRGDYILYLRSFSGSRGSLAAATLLASSPSRVVAAVSPRRIESRSVSWYLIASCFPRAFDRLHLWSTIDADWPRVVTSCMARSRAMIIDCTGMPPASFHDDGLTLEAFMSLIFAGDHPTAYTLDNDRPPPVRLPGPALLRVGSGFWWWIQNNGRLVERLRAVIRRSLTDEETRYLDAYYANIKQSYQDARISDRNKAYREGHADPQWVLMSRNPLEQFQVEAAKRKRAPPP